MTGEGYRGGIEVTIPVAMTIAGFFAISIYNVIDINIQIFSIFKKRTGLYFWSLFASSWGIVVHSLGFLLKFFRICPIDYLNIVIITIGGVPMVIGQSVVLYSRLYLVVGDRWKIRWILVMIVSSFFLFTLPPTILNFGANSNNPDPFLRPFEIYEKIALIGFSAQEFTISGLYMWETWKMLQAVQASRSDSVRRVMKHLIYVNAFVILLDLILLGLVFANAYQIETTYKSAMYSTKLKLEFPVLNQLRNLVQKRGCYCGGSLPLQLTSSGVPQYGYSQPTVLTTTTATRGSNHGSDDGRKELEGVMVVGGN
jgi:hypothetical protein